MVREEHGQGGGGEIMEARGAPEEADQAREVVHLVVQGLQLGGVRDLGVEELEAGPGGEGVEELGVGEGLGGFLEGAGVRVGEGEEVGELGGALELLFGDEEGDEVLEDADQLFDGLRRKRRAG